MQSKVPHCDHSFPTKALQEFPGRAPELEILGVFKRRCLYACLQLNVFPRIENAVDLTIRCEGKKKKKRNFAILIIDVRLKTLKYEGSRRVISWILEELSYSPHFCFFICKMGMCKIVGKVQKGDGHFLKQIQSK